MGLVPLAKISPARRAAYRILLDVERGNIDLSQALARARTHLPDQRDQALAAEIAIGTLRWRAQLDHVIGQFTRQALAGFDVEVVAILRLSTYQLLHLARVPPSAVVDEGVELAREVRKKSASGLVNAVLRKIAGRREHPPLPARPPSGSGNCALADYLGVALSHPRWLVIRWLDRYGESATEQWLRFNNEPAPIVLRANRLKISSEDLASRLGAHGVQTTPARFAPDGLRVTAGNPFRTPLERDGLFVVQEEASQLVGLVLPVWPGAHVLDACAAPGGKTTEIAARMHDDGLLVACDVRPRRVALLRETVERLGARSVRITQADVTGPTPFRRAFDSVLLDAPCSGLGTLRRDPDIKWRRQESELAAFADVEWQMLLQACEGVKPGGFLVYATCSSEPDENEAVVARFLAARSEFEALPVVERAGAALAPFTSSEGYLRTTPHQHGLEAFFAALMVRKA